MSSAGEAPGPLAGGLAYQGPGLLRGGLSSPPSGTRGCEGSLPPTGVPVFCVLYTLPAPSINSNAKSAQGP